ncbi:MAG: TolC family protein [Vampirovibrionales bacterium]|nr:TolC family protein [Vampirovibrionales bacterium]
MTWKRAFFSCGASLLFAFCFSVNTAFADVLTLDRVLNQAVESSYDYKIAKITTGISKTDIKIARADYYPQVQGYFSIERLRNVSGQRPNGAIVGNTVVPGWTNYQNAAGINLHQTLWDFGQRRQRLAIAQSDMASKSLQAEQTVRDLKMHAVDLYADAFLTHQEWHTKTVLVPLYKQLFKLDKILLDKGDLSKQKASDDALRLARAMDDAQELEAVYAEKLQALSDLTEVAYDPKDLELSELSEATPEHHLFQTVWQPELSAEAKIYDEEIEKKNREVILLKRQYLPQLSAYGYYNLYGSSVQGLHQSLQDMQSRTVTMGLNMNVPVFDGFRLQGKIEKAKLEAERLKLEKEKRLKALSKKEARFRKEVRESQASSTPENLSSQNTWPSNISWVEQIKGKLVALQNIKDETPMPAKADALRGIIDQIEQEFADYRLKIQKTAAIRKLSILYSGDS